MVGDCEKEGESSSSSPLRWPRRWRSWRRPGSTGTRTGSSCWRCPAGFGSSAPSPRSSASAGPPRRRGRRRRGRCAACRRAREGARGRGRWRRAFRLPRKRASCPKPRRRGSSRRAAGSGERSYRRGRRQGEKEERTPRPKLKPLHWDKVRASSDRVMVWDQLKSSSFQVNEEMIETLFICNLANAALKEAARRPVLPTLKAENKVLDPKKSQNIAIMLHVLNVT